MFGVEAEVLDELKAPGRDEFMIDAAKVYRDRGRCLLLVGKKQLAQADVKRADKLEAEAKQVVKESPAGKVSAVAAEKDKQPGSDLDPAKSGRIRILNSWTKSVAVAVDGTSYRVDAGEERIVPKLAGPFIYEVDAVAGHRAKANLSPGETYVIKIRPQ